MEEDYKWAKHLVHMRRSVLTGFVSAYKSLSKHGDINMYWVRNLDLHLFTIHNCLRHLDESKAKLADLEKHMEV